MNHKNKQPKPVALVTGSARRIGAAIVQRLHAAGFRVAIHCHQSLTQAHELAEVLNAARPGSAVVVQADLRLPAALDDLIEEVLNWGEQLDVLVNNASVFTRTNLQSADPCVYEMLYAINVFAPWHLSLKARPWLEKTQGTIINITDIHAKKPLKAYAEYCQTKAALTMQTKALAREFAPNIRVNAVAPGAIMWPEDHNCLSAAVKNQILQETPLNIHGQPSYIADAVYSLVMNPFITGQVLCVDGGRSLR